jgi:hypothetical protein
VEKIQGHGSPNAFENFKGLIQLHGIYPVGFYPTGFFYALKCPLTLAAKNNTDE